MNGSSDNNGTNQPVDSLPNWPLKVIELQAKIIELQDKQDSSTEVVEFRQKIAELEQNKAEWKDKYQGAVRALENEKARVKELDKLIDKKPEVVDNSKKVNGLEQKVCELTNKLEEERRQSKEKIDELTAKIAQYENGNSGRKRRQSVQEGDTTQKQLRCLQTMSSQKTPNMTVVAIDRLTDLTEYPSWESLPWPALKRILSFLHSNKECIDLANLAKVSTHFYNAVNEFMNSDGNLPGFDAVRMEKIEEALSVKISLYSINLPYYDLTNLDSSRFERSMHENSPMLQVTLRGAEDPAVKQVLGLLSSPIEEIWIDGEDDDGMLSRLSQADLALCANLVKGAPRISKAWLHDVVIDDINAPSIISIASLIKDDFGFTMPIEDPEPLSDPAAFFKYLDCQHVNLNTRLIAINTFYGLPHSFWEEFINEKLKNGSLDYVRVISNGENNDDIVETIREAPITLPDGMVELDWRKTSTN